MWTLIKVVELLRGEGRKRKERVEIGKRDGGNGKEKWGRRSIWEERKGKR